MINNQDYKSVYRLLQFSAFSVFLGRAWQHFYWDAPFRTLLWDEKIMSPIITSLSSMSWETYITSMEVNDQITFLIKAFGLFYFCCAILTLFINKLPSFVKYILILGSIPLILLALLYCKERFFSIGQFFEYTLQFGSPLFLYYFLKNLKNQDLSPSFLLTLKIAIALTFTCHGLYALGYYPIPANFLEMTMNILGVNEDIALPFLKIAGILDFIIAIGIFLPWKWAKYFLMYAIFWGLATTIARVWANFHWEFIGDVLFQWLHESIMRMPHFLIPLAVFVSLKKKLKK